MQGEGEKFTFPSKKQQVFCENCIRTGDMHILWYEVRNHERGRKKADPLGGGRSQTSGDPLRTPGEPGTELKKKSFPSWKAFWCKFILRHRTGLTTQWCWITDAPKARHYQPALPAKKQDRGKRSCFSFVQLQRISRLHASERSTRCRKRDGRTWAGREPLPHHRNERR